MDLAIHPYLKGVLTNIPKWDNSNCDRRSQALALMDGKSDELASAAGPVKPAATSEMYLYSPRPGYWRCTELPDGTLVETEVSREEWHRLLEEDMARKNAIIDKLNHRPLNLAALIIMLREKVEFCSPGSLRRLHVLSLARHAIPLDVESDEPPLSEFLPWVESVGSMAAALTRLEDHVTPEDLLDMDATEAGEEVLIALGVNLMK